jgi:hypothetical protein
MMPLGVLTMPFAIPLMGLCLALAAPPENETRQLNLAARNAVIGVVTAAAFAVVATFPAETVFLLSAFGPDAAELLLAVSAALAVGLPPALRESPVLDNRAAPAR